MLKTRLLHPEILRVLASSGHFSQILIADGNYPFLSHSRSEAARVYLNLMPGIPKATDVLQALLETIPVQAAAVMQIPSGEEAPILAEYRALLPEGIGIDRLARQDFYAAVCSPSTTLVIATAETRRFANLLLTMGVVRLEQDEAY